MAYCGPRGIARSEFLGWSDEDQQWALGWLAAESVKCPGCGNHPDDAFHPDVEEEWDAKLVRCHACAARDHAMDADPDLKPHGLFVVPVRRR